MRRAFLPTILLALCASVAVAGAQQPSATLTAVPNGAGQPSHLHLEASGSSSGLGATIPQGISLELYRGFAADLAAVPVRCASAQASQHACPAQSRVATGSFSGSFRFATASGPFSGTIAAFLGPASGGDLADVFVDVSVGGQSYAASGQLRRSDDPTFGYELRFDPLPQATVPAGAQVTLDRLTVDTGAESSAASVPAAQTHRRARTVPRRCRSRACRRHKRRRHRRKAHAAAVVHLITNPSSCSGSWPAQLRVRYSDHTDTHDAPIACTP